MPIFKSLFVAFLMVYASGCGCTDVGCGEGLTFQVKKTSVDWEPGHYVFTLDADGKSNTCTADFPLMADPICTAGMLLDASGDTPGSSSASAGPTTRVVKRLITSFSPAKATFSVSRDGTQIASYTYTPAYNEQFPNGESCGPTCKVAEEVLTVP